MKLCIVGFLFAFSACFSSLALAQTTQEYSAVQNVSADAAGHIKVETLTNIEPNNSYDRHIHSYWENRYVTEGRDNLANKGITSVSTELNYENFIIIPWFAKGINTDYSEVNLNIIYATVLSKNLELLSGYSAIASREESSNAYDNEVSLELIYSFAQQVQLISSLYYSFDAQGAFLDVALNKHYQLTPVLQLDFKTSVGFNSGYVADGHNGANHVQFSANLSYSVIKNMQLYAYSNYSFAINKDSNRYADDELLQDVFWAGLGLSYQYR